MPAALMEDLTLRPPRARLWLGPMPAALMEDLTLRPPRARLWLGPMPAALMEDLTLRPLIVLLVFMSIPPCSFRFLLPLPARTIRACASGVPMREIARKLAIPKVDS